MICDFCYDLAMPTRYFSKKKQQWVKYNYCKRKRDDPNYINPRINLKSPHSKKLKEEILKRDKKCRICGGTKNLDVHHKDNKGLSIVTKPNQNPKNLEVLCHRCHIRKHYGVLYKHEDIMKRRQNGETLQSIGKSYKISRQRVLQIIQANT